MVEYDDHYRNYDEDGAHAPVSRRIPEEAFEDLVRQYKESHPGMSEEQARREVGLGIQQDLDEELRIVPYTPSKDPAPLPVRIRFPKDIKGIIYPSTPNAKDLN